MLDTEIRMVDLNRQYLRLKEEIDAAVSAVVQSGMFINGPQVKRFADRLAGYLEVPFVIPCGNGTDALQIALMALDLQPGDEVILPAFTYVAAAEAVALLGLTPVLVDVDPDTFNLDPQKIEEAISRDTKAIIAVHLFGQVCDMEAVLRIAKTYRLYVIEDNAQSIGAEYTFSDGRIKKSGTIGHIGTTSFFPSKPLACYGDGGALITSDARLAERIRMLANHGQVQKYHHVQVGCNSRLDTLQAAILEVKLRYITEFAEARREVARRYDEVLSDNREILKPGCTAFSSHVYHQYTLRIGKGKRNELQAYLKEKGIPSMVYYPLALQDQEAYKWRVRIRGSLKNAVGLARSVLSLPIHTEMLEDEIHYISDTIREAHSAIFL